MPKSAAHKTSIGSKILFWGPPLLWMGLIFFFSSMSDPRRWARWIWPVSGGPRTPDLWTEFLIFKSGHFLEYAILAWLLFRALAGQYPSSPKTRSLSRAAWLTVLASAVYAATDEIHQSFVPGREAAVRDVFIDTWGAAIAAWLRLRRTDTLTGNRLKLPVPPTVGRIAAKLKAASHQAFLVGGSVRDCLIGRQPRDWDIATDARPEQVQALFERTVPTGLRFGTVTVLSQDPPDEKATASILPVEVTTFRKDGSYGDGRRPDRVEFGKSIEKDLARRDFTVNAIACDPDSGTLVDPFGGAADIQARVIRAVGRPEERFREDALRLLRAVRLAAELEFSVDPETLAAIKDNAQMISRVSAERVRDELTRLLLATSAIHGLKLLADSGLLAQIIPEIGHNPQVDTALEICARTPSEISLRLAGLFYILPLPTTAHEILTRLKFDGRTARDVLVMLNERDWQAPDSKKARRLIARVGRRLIPSLAALRLAASRQQPQTDNKSLTEALNNSWSEAISVKELSVSGQDILALGVPPGPMIGTILNNLLEAVLDNPGLNRREILLALARDLAGDQTDGP